MQMSFKERIEHFIESGFQAIYIATAERSRCEEELAAVAKKAELKFVTWDGISGFTAYEDGKIEETGNCKDPIEALLSMDEEEDPKWKNEEGVLFVMRNFHIFLEDPAVRQQFQNLYYGRKLSNKMYKRPIVIVANAMQIHTEIAPCITVTEFSLPTELELDAVFAEVCDNIEVDESRPGAIATYDDEMRGRVVQAMRGLTTLEAENILAYSLRVNRGFAPGLVDTIEDQKALTIEKSEVLTYVPKERIASMDEIGGYEELKEFIGMRKLAYTKKARALNIDLPRGIVLLGVPGTGKSVVGKVIARDLGLPLVVLNISAVFGSLVGESERRIRTALSTIDALDGAVVLVDEAEKALGGANDANGDSGVSRRVFGVVLTWLTEKKSRTFVVMTMNRTRGIPPEFLRKGRFDEIFWTDLPSPEERDMILRIHCRKRDVSLDGISAEDWETKLIPATDRYVGAELEQIVCDARFMAFAARQSGQPTIEEFMRAANLVVPIADAERENIDDIRRTCENRARPVSRPRKVQPKRGRAITIG
jgi:ATP-dependent 26S proteasome regulatory subunit